MSNVISHETNRKTFESAQGAVLLLLRLSMVPLFYFSGWGKLMNISATADRLPGGHEGIGMVMAVGATAVELIGATLLLIGPFARPTALVFILYIIAATLMFHNFWASPPEMVVVQTLNFLKNLGLLGGMAVIAAFGPGPYAVNAGRS